MRLFAGLAAMVAAMAPAATAQTPYASVTSSQYGELKSKPALIDVREPNEWASTGMPVGSSGVSISDPAFVDVVAAKLGGDKSKPVAVICKSGTRSERAAKMLSAAGFTNVTNVADGVSGRPGVGAGWIGSGLPVVRPKD